MSDGQAEEQAASVPSRATQAADRRARWAWIEPSVWSDRMLEALEQGVKGGKWFSLIDKVRSMRTLSRAWERVARNDGAPGVDGQTVARFERKRLDNLARLESELLEGHYRPQAVRRVWIEKPGSRQKRPLGVPTVRDRVVQTALRFVLEPIFERDFAQHSYGFRPRRSCKDALRVVAQGLAQGYTWVVDADLQSYFDTIPHEALMQRLRQKVADGTVLGLVEGFLKQGVLEQMRHWQPEAGTPQGAIISPLLANIYLDPLDQMMQQAGWKMVRYADDFVVLCRSEQEAQDALEAIGQWTQDAGLKLHPQKTTIVDATRKGAGFDFLGYHFEQDKRWPRPKSVKKFKDKIRELTRRANGHSLECIIKQINPVSRGWFEYFKHSTARRLDNYDGWIRMRLRSILRKRGGRKGRGRGADHQRWPNAFFAERGLFSIIEARANAVQPAQAANH